MKKKDNNIVMPKENVFKTIGTGLHIQGKNDKDTIRKRSTVLQKNIEIFKNKKYITKDKRLINFLKEDAINIMEIDK